VMGCATGSRELPGEGN